MHILAKENPEQKAILSASLNLVLWFPAKELEKEFFVSSRQMDRLENVNQDHWNYVELELLSARTDAGSQSWSRTRMPSQGFGNYLLCRWTNFYYKNSSR